MAVPKIVQDLREIKDTAIFPTDDEVVGPDTIPVDADTLQGHPLEHFASVEYVSQYLHSYISSVLNRTY